MEPRSLRQLMTAYMWIWPLGGILTALGVWMPLEVAGHSLEPLSVIVCTGLAIGFAAFMARPFIHETRRVVVLKLVSGLGIVVIFGFFFVVTGAYFVVVLGHSWFDQALRILTLACLISWCWLQVRGFRSRIQKTRFMEQEFHVEENRIIMRSPTRTDLSAPPISDKKLFGKLYNNLGPYLLMLLPFAYPLQRLFADTGGEKVVLFLLAILGLPLTFYVTGKLTCGAYLNLYRVRQLERQHGKPVVFDDDAFPNSAKR